MSTEARILLFIGTLVAALSLPWWIALCLLVIGAFVYGHLETLVLGFLFDIVFAPPPGVFLHAFLLLAFVCYACGATIRPYLRLGTS